MSLLISSVYLLFKITGDSKQPTSLSKFSNGERQPTLSDILIAVFRWNSWMIDGGYCFFWQQIKRWNFFGNCFSYLMYRNEILLFIDFWILNWNWQILKTTHTIRRTSSFSLDILLSLIALWLLCTSPPCCKLFITPWISLQSYAVSRVIPAVYVP